MPLGVEGGEGFFDGEFDLCAFDAEDAALVFGHRGCGADVGGASLGVEDPDRFDAHVEEVLDAFAHSFEGVAGRESP